jgi:hypothetical protein
MPPVYTEQARKKIKLRIMPAGNNDVGSFVKPTGYIIPKFGIRQFQCAFFTAESGKNR